MKNLFNIFIFGLVFQTNANAQNKLICGKTTPRLCVDQVVWTQTGSIWNGAYEAKIADVALDGLSYSIVLTSNNSRYDKISVKELGLTTKGLCTLARPKICIDNTVITIPGSYWNVSKEAKVVAISHDRKNVTVSIKNGSINNYSNIEPETVALTTSGRCGSEKPKLCVDDQIITKSGAEWRGMYEGIIVGVSSNGKTYAIKLFKGNQLYSGVSSEGLTVTSRANTVSVDSLHVFLSTETDDTVSTLKAFASVVTKERALFLNQMSGAVSKQNSEFVNIFAGLLTSKIVRLSTAQVVKDHFEPRISEYLGRIDTLGWKSVLQIPANEQTISFAIQIIAAGVRVRNTQAGISPENKIRLETLASVAAKRGMVAKANALKEYLSSNMALITDLVADPRHGAIGSVVADTAQWVDKQFEE